jgi:hypothetical protein
MRARALPSSVVMVVFACIAHAGCSSSSDGPAPSTPIGDASLDAPAPGEDAASPLPDGAGPSSDAGTSVDGGEGGAGGPSPELALFCQKYGAAFCSALDGCALPPTPDCVNQSIADCTAGLVSVQSTITSGRVVYDATQVDSCFADSQRPFCAVRQLGAGVASCAGVFHGTVAVGAPCFDTNYFFFTAGRAPVSECATGYCNVGQPCEATCKAYLASGAACALNSSGQGDPATGLCDPVTAYCDGAHCTPWRKVGETCDTVSVTCDPSLVCGTHASDSGSLICEVLGEEGDACLARSECDDFQCLTDTCRPGHAGEPCLGVGRCDVGLKCGESGCAAPIALDGACDPTGEFEVCADGTTCEAVGLDDAGLETGACHAPRSPTAGQPCFDFHCASGFWCKSTSLSDAQCAAPSPSGGTCLAGDDTTCAAGLTCNGALHTCQAPSVAGGPCALDWVKTCAPGFGCGPQKTCEADVAEGAACDTSKVCPSDDYCDVTCKAAKAPGAACTGKTGECGGGVCDASTHVCTASCVDPG